MSNKGKDLGGIRSVDDIKDRCRVDDVTGCWIWAGALVHGKAPRVWVPGLGAVSMSRALQVVHFGPPPAGKRTLMPTCGGCTEPATSST